jgi:hypothetical protein
MPFVVEEMAAPEKIKSPTAQKNRSRILRFLAR